MYIYHRFKNLPTNKPTAAENQHFVGIPFKNVVRNIIYTHRKGCLFYHNDRHTFTMINNELGNNNHTMLTAVLY